MKPIFLQELDEMQDFTVLEEYKRLLKDVQNAMYKNDVDIGKLAEAMGMGQTTMYIRRHDPTKFTLGELEEVLKIFGWPEERNTAIKNYENLLEELNNKIKKSNWKKVKLMEHLAIGKTRQLLLMKKPQAWRLPEVEKLLKLLYSNEGD